MNSNSTTSNSTTKVLWISRHNMTPDQVADLERIYGTIEVTQVTETVTDIRGQLGAAIEAADVVAVVLPIGMLPDVLRLAGNRPVIQAKNDRIPTGNMVERNGKLEQEFQFRFAGWFRVRKVEVVLEAL